MLVGYAAIMRSQELSIMVVILSVSLPSREVTLSSNVNIACSTATSLSPLLGKVFSIVLLYLESHTRYRKSRKLEEPLSCS